MSNENAVAIRSNFASRLLSKAMNDRSKPASKVSDITTPATAKYASEVEARQPVTAGKS